MIIIHRPILKTIFPNGSMTSLGQSFSMTSLEQGRLGAEFQHDKLQVLWKQVAKSSDGPGYHLPTVIPSFLHNWQLACFVLCKPVASLSRHNTATEVTTTCKPFSSSECLRFPLKAAECRHTRLEFYRCPWPSTCVAKRHQSQYTDDTTHHKRHIMQVSICRMKWYTISIWHLCQLLRCSHHQHGNCRSPFEGGVLGAKGKSLANPFTIPAQPFEML